MPQTPQWSLGWNSSPCQFFYSFGQHWTMPLELRKFALSVVFVLKPQIFKALEAWLNDVQMWNKISWTWVLTQTPLWSLRHISKNIWVGPVGIKNTTYTFIYLPNCDFDGVSFWICFELRRLKTQRKTPVLLYLGVSLIYVSYSNILGFFAKYKLDNALRFVRYIFIS